MAFCFDFRIRYHVATTLLIDLNLGFCYRFVDCFLLLKRYISICTLSNLIFNLAKASGYFLNEDSQEEI